MDNINLDKIEGYQQNLKEKTCTDLVQKLAKVCDLIALFIFLASFPFHQEYLLSNLFKHLMASRGMAYNSIAISGLPRAGKTTLIKKLVKELNWEVLHIGGIFRKKYEDWKSKNPDKNVSFEEFYADRNLLTYEDVAEANELAKKRLRKGKVILDSRFSSINCHGVESVLKVFVTAPIKVRAERAKEDGTYSGTINEIISIIKKRERDEAKLGNDLYGHLFPEGFDYKDKKHYDLILDSSKLTIKEEINLITKKLNEI